MRSKQHIRIGTSGFHYDHWKGPFYPEKIKGDEQLDWYSKVFDTVEMNNTFYRMPTLHMVREWVRQTPDNFLFAVKASRYITHVKKLHVTKAPVDALLKRLSHFGDKLGPVLFQLPPKWKYNGERLEALLKRLSSDYRYVFEFRDTDWYRDEVYELLAKYNCAFCIYELAGHQSPMQVTADFVYVRLHGPGANKYQGSYTDRQLKDWAAQCRNWQQDKKDVYLYFDNDQKGYAAQNAQTIQELMHPAS